MPFSVDDKHLIKVIREEKHYTACDFLREFPNKKWSRRGLNHILKKIDKFGCFERLAGSGRLRSTRNAENVESVCELVQSQEDRPHIHYSVRQIAHSAHISRSCVHDIIKKDLQVKSLKRRKAQELTEANNLAKRQRAKELLKKYPAHSVDYIWFSDEKLFTVVAPNNSQNDRIYVHSCVRKRKRE